jgi:hypothetical protein
LADFAQNKARINVWQFRLAPRIANSMLIFSTSFAMCQSYPKMRAAAIWLIFIVAENAKVLGEWE